MATFIAKYKYHILDFLQIGLFFLLGFRFAKIEMIISILLFCLVIARFVFQNKFSEIKEIGKKEIIDLIVLAGFMVFTVLFKTIFDGASSIFQNSFHFIFLIIMFFLSVRVTKTQYGLNGLTPLIAYFVGSFLYISLSCGITFADFGLKSNVRLCIDVWTRDYFTCTLASLYLLPFIVLCLFAFIYYLNKKNFLLSFLFLVPVIISFYVSIRLSNRGFFAAFFIAAFLMCIFTYLSLDVDKHKRYDLLMYVPLIVTTLALGIFLLSHFNVLGIGDALKKIPFLNRVLSGGTDATRKQIYIDFFKESWKYPFGGLIQKEAIGSGRYVHNMILDIYGNAGIVPFTLFLCLLIRFVVSIFFKKIYKGNTVKFLLISTLFMGIISISFFEPVFDANGYYFASIFAFFSIISRDDPINFKTIRNRKKSRKIIEQKDENQTAN